MTEDQVHKYWYGPVEFDGDSLSAPSLLKILVTCLCIIRIVFVCCWWLKVPATCLRILRMNVCLLFVGCLTFQQHACVLQGCLFVVCWLFNFFPTPHSWASATLFLRCQRRTNQLVLGQLACSRRSTGIVVLYFLKNLLSNANGLNKTTHLKVLAFIFSNIPHLML